MFFCKKKLWRCTYCGGNGGLIIAKTKELALKKLQKKYGANEVAHAEVWPWENDDYFDSKNPDVLNIYDCG